MQWKNKMQGSSCLWRYSTQNPAQTWVSPHSPLQMLGLHSHWRTLQKGKKDQWHLEWTNCRTLLIKPFWTKNVTQTCSIYKEFGSYKCTKINTGGPCHLWSTRITETSLIENFLWGGFKIYSWNCTWFLVWTDTVVEDFIFRTSPTVGFHDQTL